MKIQTKNFRSEDGKDFMKEFVVKFMRSRYH